MTRNSPAVDPEVLHPSLWRASQLARANTPCVDTGHTALSAHLPGQGWPRGTMIDILSQQPGIGEIRLLSPALAHVANRGIVLITPPHPPQIQALAGLGLSPSKVTWVRADRTGDALWAAEQVLRGSCGALVLWQTHLRADSGRRLHLAAQAGETLFFMMRPLAAAMDPSPAPLRLGLRPAAGGLMIDFVKRRGPKRDDPLFLPLSLATAVRTSQPHVASAGPVTATEGRDLATELLVSSS